MAMCLLVCQTIEKKNQQRYFFFVGSNMELMEREKQKAECIERSDNEKKMKINHQREGKKSDPKSLIKHRTYVNEMCVLTYLLYNNGNDDQLYYGDNLNKHHHFYVQIIYKVPY